MDDSVAAKNDWKKLPNEASLMNAVRADVIPPGK
jgi:hypothetical protein